MKVKWTEMGEKSRETKEIDRNGDYYPTNRRY